MEQYSADTNLLIEAIIVEIEKVVLKRVESVFQEDSYKYPLIDNFHVLNFRSEEANATLDSRAAIDKWKNVDWDIDWRDGACSYGKI